VTNTDQLKKRPPTRAIGHSEESGYDVVESGKSVDAPLLAQLSALGFSDEQLPTLSRLSPETQEEVYVAVVKLMMEDDPALDDILGMV
jgi:hypothetical protein